MRRIWLLSRGTSTKWEMMKYYNDMYLNLNKDRFSQKHTKGLQEDIMWDGRQHRRFFAPNCGGQLYIKFQKCTVGPMTHVNGLGNHRKGTKCRSIHRWRSSRSKNGWSTLWGPSHLKEIQVRTISSPRQNTWLDGRKHNRLRTARSLQLRKFCLKCVDTVWMPKSSNEWPRNTLPKWNYQCTHWGIQGISSTKYVVSSTSEWDSQSFQ